MSDGYKIYATEKYVEANYSLKSKLSTISLLASEWVGVNSPYRQTVAIDCVAGNSKVDLQPTESQIAALQDAEISLVASNDNGVVTIYAIGGKPKEDYTIQVVITEANISNDGGDNVSGNNGGITIEQAEAIKANTIARHIHDNINTLDKLGEKDNNLTYDGKRVVDERTLAVVDEYNALYSLDDNSLLCYVSTDRVGFAPVALEAGIQYGGLYDYQDKSQLWIDPLLLNFFPCEAFTVTTESVLFDEGRNLYCHYEFATDGLTYFYVKYFLDDEMRYVVLFNNSSAPIVVDNITFPVGWGEYSYYFDEGNVAVSIDDYNLYRQSFGVPSLKFSTDEHFAELQNILSEKSTYSGVRGYYQYYNGRWQSINFAQISVNTNSAISSSHYHHNQDILDAITPETFVDKNELPEITTNDNGKVLGVVDGAWVATDGGTSLPVAYINDKGELCFELGSGIKDARINDKGELELVIETENGDKTIILGKIKGRTPELRLTEKILEIKYDDENTWSTLVDFSTIASSFDLRLNEETYFLEAQREVGGEWEPMADLSALKLAHDHSNKEILDKITSSVFADMDDAIKKKHTHDNFDVLDGITNEQINNINEIPTIKEDIEKLSSSPSSKQLVEGLLYSDENAKGLSANKKAMPTADYVWIEGNASSYLSYDSIGTAVLNVVTTTTTKSTTTTATIDVTCLSSDNALNYYNKITSNYLYMMVIFNNELSNQTPINTKINYYLKITSATISGNIVKMNFVFLNGKDTFPLTGNYSQKISMFYNYPVNGTASHAEGSGTLAVGTNSHAEGTNTIAKGITSHAEGAETVANGITSHAEGAETVANGIFTHAEGCGTQAEGSYSHVQGKYNEIDMENKYAHIVGNGTSDSERSNAHTLDWEGNAWYAGSVESKGIILPSSTEGSTKKFLITVDDSGTLAATEIIEEATTE